VVNNLKLKRPFEGKFFVLFELSGNKVESMDSQISEVIEKLMEDGLVEDGTYSSELTTMNKLWEFRERIQEATQVDGHSYIYDVSMPLEHYYDLVEVMKERLSGKPVKAICGLGHIGDCNLHIIITSAKFYEEIFNTIEPFLFQWLQKRRGSISAEHGLGIIKRNYIHYTKSKETIAAMMKLKQLFDPKNILNPGKLLPDSI